MRIESVDTHDDAHVARDESRGRDLRRRLVLFEVILGELAVNAAPEPGSCVSVLP